MAHGLLFSGSDDKTVQVRHSLWGHEDMGGASHVHARGILHPTLPLTITLTRTLTYDKTPNSNPNPEVDDIATGESLAVWKGHGSGVLALVHPALKSPEARGGSRGEAGGGSRGREGQ